MKKKVKKGKSQTWYRKKCVEIAKKNVKERDNYICQKCGKKVEGMNAHGSHIYNEGTYRGMSADEDNILTMCYYCHINWWHKNPLEASEWIKGKYPELVKKLKERSNKTLKTNWELKYQELTK